MKFSHIFAETKILWPEEIPIDDGKLFDDEGGYFPTLSSIWDQIEQEILGETMWVQLMVWSIFTALHKEACSSRAGGADTLRLSAIDLAYVEYKFSESLMNSDLGYPEGMQKTYENDLE